MKHEHRHEKYNCNMISRFLLCRRRTDSATVKIHSPVLCSVQMVRYLLKCWHEVITSFPLFVQVKIKNNVVGKLTWCWNTKLLKAEGAWSFRFFQCFNIVILPNRLKLLPVFLCNYSWVIQWFPDWPCPQLTVCFGNLSVRFMRSWSCMITSLCEAPLHTLRQSAADLIE